MTGKHTNVEEQPTPTPETGIDITPSPAPIIGATNGNHIAATQSQTSQPERPAVPGPTPVPVPVPQESDSDDSSLPVPPDAACRRRGCNAKSPGKGVASRDGEVCIHHPGQALFHEGSKGWTCCKPRALEFEEFMKIEGCKRKNKHLFVGSNTSSDLVENISNVRYEHEWLMIDSTHALTYRHDFYQTSTSVIASLFLKKIDKGRAKIKFISSTKISLDLPTAENKVYKTELPLFSDIDTAKSTYKILGTKMELTLVKLDAMSWPTLRSDEQRTSEIIQVGKAGRA